MRALIVAIVLAVPVATASAAPTPTPYEGTANGRFFHIIPPGQGGNANALQAAQFESSGQRPPHFSDQRDMYTNLLYASPGLSDDQIGTYFPDESFGVKPGDVERTYSPRSDVTIVRDKSVGTPHVYGSTRAGTTFGTGYAIAEDRLFFMDVLRHYGAGKLASFAGGANVGTDLEQFSEAPYTDADIQKQLDDLPLLYGAEGQNLVDDVTAWCAGVNAYIAEARLNPTKMPVEYAAINQPQGPENWKPTDVLRAASLIGAQLGKGGGNELSQLELLEKEIDRFGRRKGVKVWQDLRSLDDPEAPVTATRKAGFPYDQIPKKALKTVAIPDKGTLERVSPQVGGDASAAAKADGPLKGLLRFPQSDSNALLVSAKHSQTGHPLTVFGSQAGYFQPEIWWGVEAHGPGFDVRGATIPGTGPYVEIGRGRDYAWSATSASQDIIDVYALDTCQDDMHYRYRGECLPMDVVEQSESWVPSAADQTAAGSATFRALRTKLGIVVARAKIKGKPVVYTRLRSTYGHEFDSGLGFQRWQDPEKVKNVQDFQNDAMGVGYTFNWLYTDDKDIGYINTGFNPQRAKGVNGLLPIRYRQAREWKGFDPATNSATYQPQSQRPQAINQKYLVSWNNKQARHCCGGASFTPLWRSQLLTDGLDERLKAGGGKLSLAQVVDAAEDAATKDLRGDKTIPVALKALGKPKDQALADAAAKLRAWAAEHAHRIDRDRDGHYEATDAVRITDAWMQTLPKAVFGPRMGDDLFKTMDADVSPDLPNSFHGGHDHLGSAWEDGWHGYLQKDLRTVLTPKRVRGKWHVRFCGGGKRKACRAAVRASLKEALAIDPAKLYEDPTLAGEDCGAMDTQACFDSIRYRPLGLIDHPLQPWQNRPTQQQVVEVTSHR